MSDDQYPTNFTDEYAREKASRLQCSIDYSDDYTLQLDIDGPEAYNIYVQQMALVRELDLFQVVESLERESRSGNKHVIIKLLYPLPMTQRIMLQSFLGSDRKREMLAYAGMLRGQENPVLLFRPAPALDTLVF